jgi:hypothetical protein
VSKGLIGQHTEHLWRILFELSKHRGRKMSSSSTAHFFTDSVTARQRGSLVLIFGQTATAAILLLIR